MITTDDANVKKAAPKEIHIEKGLLMVMCNAILESTKCRDLCKMCATGKPNSKIMLEGRCYGHAMGGCCGGCTHITNTGCKAKGNTRSLWCTMWACEILRKRLREFGLDRWWTEFRFALRTKPSFGRKLNNGILYATVVDTRLPGAMKDDEVICFVPFDGKNDKRSIWGKIG